MLTLHVFLLGALCLAVHGYISDLVENPDDYHPDTVYHQSYVEGINSNNQMTQIFPRNFEYIYVILCFIQTVNLIYIVKNQTAFYLVHSIGNMIHVSVSIFSARAGTQPSRRVPLWAAGRKDENYDNCYIPYDGDEHAQPMPFEVKYSK